MEGDPFKAPENWPGAFSTAVFWLAIVAIVWLLCGHPGLGC